LCHYLNAKERLKATLDDIQTCIDKSFSKTIVFDELWKEQPEAEREWLRKMLKGSIAVDTPDIALKNLVRLNYVEIIDNRYTIAIPMFAAWIDMYK
jgi:hypothetical protein